MSTYIAGMSAATYFVTQSSSLCPSIHSTNLSIHSSIHPLTHLSSYIVTHLLKHPGLYPSICPSFPCSATRSFKPLIYQSVPSSIYPL